METVAIAPALRVIDYFAGEVIRWFRYLGPCPCSDVSKGTYNRTHALCGGTGKLKEEVNVSTFRAIITSVTASKIYTGIGELQTGDLTCATWPDEIPLKKFDEVLIPSRPLMDTAVIKRGAPGAVDALPHAHVLQIHRLFDMNGPVTSGWALQESGVAWSSGPAKGAQYTVLYRYLPRWEVLGDSALVRAPDPGGASLPQKVGLRLVDAVK